MSAETYIYTVFVSPAPRTATLLSGMLVSVINNGHARLAGVEGYYLAGKTGTAQLHDTIKKGYSDKTIHSFVGFGPVDSPVFAMITKLDEVERDQITIALKVDENVKMGLISDVQMELRKANARKLMYSVPQRTE